MQNSFRGSECEEDDNNGGHFNMSDAVQKQKIKENSKEMLLR